MPKKRQLAKILGTPASREDERQAAAASLAKRVVKNATRRATGRKK